ncbi:MAG: hypothetical protein ACK4PR_06150, partial [Gammaproteobacteria bacterium]
MFRIQNEVIRSGFVTGLSWTEQGNYFEGTGSFIHLTLQEYFIAFYLTWLWETNSAVSINISHKDQAEILHWDNVEEFIAVHKYKPRYQLILQFMAGLFNDQPKKIELFWQTILSPPRDWVGFGDWKLWLSCLNESNLNVVPEPLQEKVLSLINNKIEQELTEFNWSEGFSKEFTAICEYPKIIFTGSRWAILKKYLDDANNTAPGQLVAFILAEHFLWSREVIDYLKGNLPNAWKNVVIQKPSVPRITDDKVMDITSDDIEYYENDLSDDLSVPSDSMIEDRYRHPREVYSCRLIILAAIYNYSGTFPDWGEEWLNLYSALFPHWPGPLAAGLAELIPKVKIWFEKGLTKFVIDNKLNNKNLSVHEKIKKHTFILHAFANFSALPDWAKPYIDEAKNSEIKQLEIILLQILAKLPALPEWCKLILKDFSSHYDDKEISSKANNILNKNNNNYISSIMPLLDESSDNLMYPSPVLKIQHDEEEFNTLISALDKENINNEDQCHLLEKIRFILVQIKCDITNGWKISEIVKNFVLNNIKQLPEEIWNLFRRRYPEHSATKEDYFTQNLPYLKWDIIEHSLQILKVSPHIINEIFISQWSANDIMNMILYYLFMLKLTIFSPLLTQQSHQTPDLTVGNQEYSYFSPVLMKKQVVQKEVTFLINLFSIWLNFKNENFKNWLHLSDYLFNEDLKDWLDSNSYSFSEEDTIKFLSDYSESIRESAKPSPEPSDKHEDIASFDMHLQRKATENFPIYVKQKAIPILVSKMLGFLDLINRLDQIPSTFVRAEIFSSTPFFNIIKYTTTITDIVTQHDWLIYIAKQFAEKDLLFITIIDDTHTGNHIFLWQEGFINTKYQLITTPRFSKESLTQLQTIFIQNYGKRKFESFAINQTFMLEVRKIIPPLKPDNRPSAQPPLDTRPLTVSDKRNTFMFFFAPVHTGPLTAAQAYIGCGFYSSPQIGVTTMPNVQTDATTTSALTAATTPAPAQPLLDDTLALPPFSDYMQWQIYYREQLEKNGNDITFLNNLMSTHLANSARIDNILLDLVRVAYCGNPTFIETLVGRFCDWINDHAQTDSIMLAIPSLVQGLQQVTSSVPLSRIINLFNMVIKQVIEKEQALTGQANSQSLLIGLIAANSIVDYLWSQRATIGEDYHQSFVQISLDLLTNLKTITAKYPQHYFLATRVSEGLKAIVAIRTVAEADKKREAAT